MDNYPFVKCLHPVRMRNPYTQENITVACGKCEACLSRKADINSFKIQCESKCHKYCLFITLTFSEDNVPRFVFRPREDGLFDFYDITKRTHLDGVPTLLEEGVQLSEVTSSTYEKYISALSMKTGSKDGSFTFADVRELQLWLKRIRKYVYSNTQETLRYYAISEYGPVHFRAHFHVLLFFDKPETLALFSESGKCPRWKYGRTSCELSKGSAASYVSSYLSSFCSLPEIFKIRSTRPKSYHSIYFGEGVFENEFEEIYASASYEALSVSCNFGKSSECVYPWRSYYLRLFPRCIGYAGLSSDQKLRIYSIFLESRKYISGCSSVLDYAKRIIDNLNFGILSTAKGDCYDFYHFVSSLVVDSSTFVGSCTEDCDLLDRYYTSLYRILLCSRLTFRILSRVCQSPKLRIELGILSSDPYSVQSMRSFITCMDRFYSSFELSQLRQFYTSQQRFFDDKYFGLFYDNYNIGNFYSFLKSTDLYKSFRESSLSRSNDRVKHKVLNDQNNIFVSLLNSNYGKEHYVSCESE